MDFNVFYQKWTFLIKQTNKQKVSIETCFFQLTSFHNIYFSNLGMASGL